MSPGDIVLFRFLDTKTNTLVDRPAIITSKCSDGSCDSDRNLYVFFEPADNPEGIGCTQLLVPFGDHDHTWQRRQ